MRHTPHYLMTDPGEVKRLIRNNPWATFVSPVNGELVASHYPVILDEAASQGSDIAILSHFGRPDDELHELGQHRVLVIIQGPRLLVAVMFLGRLGPVTLVSALALRNRQRLYELPEGRPIVG